MLFPLERKRQHVAETILFGVYGMGFYEVKLKMRMSHVDSVVAPTMGTSSGIALSPTCQPSEHP